jgi:hypothetical protein
MKRPCVKIDCNALKKIEKADGCGTYYPNLPHGPVIASVLAGE